MEEFPAATAYVTPAATERQIASCSGSPVKQPDRLGLEPLPPRLMLATSILPALRVTQSTPQMTFDHEPAPEASSTRTAHSPAPGATPTTPVALSRAAAMPAMSTLTLPVPLPDAVLDRTPSTRLMPVGSRWASRWTGRSATTAATRGSLRRASRSEERRVGKECRSRWSPDH